MNDTPTTIPFGEGFLAVVGGVVIVDGEAIAFDGDLAAAEEFAAEFGGTAYPVVSL